MSGCSLTPANRPAKKSSFCVYPLWESLKGRGKGGEYALAIARHFCESQGYEVLVSTSVRENSKGLILASYPRLREEGHPAYKRKVKLFGEERLREFNNHATAKKLRRKETASPNTYHLQESPVAN